ncbi:helix-turn-helix domain-containing protein [Actinotalea sp.]|uniref:helix-turn-helix domain-containing protein n=1 Tax=Actinotalea sp. TaxID=1872145 RepID=UPI003566E0E5
MPAPLLSASEVAAWLNRPVPWVCEQARGGRLAGSKLGHVWRFSAEDVERYLARNAVAVDPLSMTPLSAARQRNKRR